MDLPSFEDPHIYRSIVGSLQYLAFTRPDISFVVHKVCQYMHCPRLSHWKAVKRILRYLRFTQILTESVASHIGLKFSIASSFSLSTFSDTDWVSCPDDRK